MLQSTNVSFTHFRKRFRVLFHIHFLSKNNTKLISILPGAEFSVYISQDGYDKRVTEVIQTYTAQRKAFWLGFDYELTSKTIMKGFKDFQWKSYHKISAHYKWALNYLFSELNYDQVILLEDDMQLAPDFFTYFHKASKLMSVDSSIYCISAWNDHGQREYVHDAKQLYRTDIFPGLGWMLTKAIYNELKDKWPLAFWDDWMRESEQRKNRSCIRPEINRIYTFGRLGSSNGQFYDMHLKTIYLNVENVDWTTVDIQYLLDYDLYLQDIIDNEHTIELYDVYDIKKEVVFDEMQPTVIKDYVIRYDGLQDFTNMCKVLRLMADHKAGLPRQSYRGIVTVRWNKHRLFFVPRDITWERRIVAE